MKRSFLPIGLLCCAFSSLVFAADYEIIVNVPATTPAGASLYVTGNIPSLCNWKPTCLRLEPTDVLGAYKAEFSLPDASATRTIEFKVTRGSWKDAGSFLDGSDMPNAVWDLSSGAEVVYSVPHWKDLPPKVPPQGLLTFSHFYSPQLGNERSLRILLPASYAKNPDKKYPVLYAHDGQNLFNPSTCISGSDWALDLSMNRLAADPRVQESIVVGIDSVASNERYNEYDYSIRGQKYADFLIHTVKPWVDKKFRTLTDRDHTFTMGSSMGALISVALVWNHPEVFSAAAALSLPVFIHDESVYKYTVGAKPSLPVRIYMDHGEIGRDEGYKSYCEEFFNYLLKDGFTSGQDLIYQIYPYSDHNEADWARRVDVPLRWLLSTP